MNTRFTIYVILLTITLSGCGLLLSKQERQQRRARKKIEKAIRLDPNIAQKDTIRDTVFVKVPELRIDTVIQVNQDYSGIDSIFLSFQDQLDAMTATELKQTIKNYYTTRPIIGDTVIHNFVDSLGFVTVVRVFDKDGGIGVSIHQPERKYEKPVEYVREKLVMPEKTKREQLLEWLNLIALPLILLIILILAIRFLLRLFGVWTKK